MRNTEVQFIILLIIKSKQNSLQVHLLCKCYYSDNEEEVTFNSLPQRGTQVQVVKSVFIPFTKQVVLHNICNYQINYTYTVDSGKLCQLLK